MANLHYFMKKKNCDSHLAKKIFNVPFWKWAGHPFQKDSNFCPNLPKGLLGGLKGSGEKRQRKAS